MNINVKLEARPQRAGYLLALVPALAVVLTCMGGAIFFAILGKPPLATLYSFFIAPLSSAYGIGEILLKATPLLIIAQGLAVGFRAKVWNIGAEGQLVIGAICGGALAIWMKGNPAPWVLPMMMVAGALGGMAWAGVAAFLKTRFNANEILVTLMLTQIAYQLLYYLVTGPLRDPNGFNFPQSVRFDTNAIFSVLHPDMRVTTFLFVALLFSAAMWLLVSRSFVGYRLLVGGLSPHASRYAGFSEKRAVWITLLISGLAAGLAGVGEVAGPIGMLQRAISPGYGFTAIIVAFLGGLHPLGIVPAALFMGLIYVGGDFAIIASGIPSATPVVFQGMLLCFYLAVAWLLGYRLRFGQRREAAATAT